MTMVIHKFLFFFKFSNKNKLLIHSFIDPEKPTQAPAEIVSLFHGSRQIVYAMVSNCNQAILNANLGKSLISTMVFFFSFDYKFLLSKVKKKKKKKNQLYYLNYIGFNS